MKSGRASGTVSLLGDFATAPLVAFSARVPIAGNLVDTNVQRFDSGDLVPADVFRVLDRHPDALLLRRENRGLSTRASRRGRPPGQFREIGCWSASGDTLVLLGRRRASN